MPNPNRINVAKQNLLTWSEDLTNAAWQKGNLGGTGSPVATLQAVGTSGPFAGTTATKIDMPALAGVNNYNLIINPFTAGVGFLQTFRGAWMKGAVGGEIVGLFCGQTNTGQQFTLTNQWAYYEFKQTDTGSTYNLEIGNDRRVAGTVDTPIQSFYISCIQLSQGDQRPQYVQTTSTTVNNGVRKLVGKQGANLLTFPNDFTNAIWVKTAIASVTPNSTLNPFGTANDASTLTESNATNYHYINQAYTTNLSDAPREFTIYAKAKERNFVVLQLANIPNKTLAVDLTTGAYSFSSPPTGRASVMYIQNGWWKISIYTSDPVDSNTVGIFVSNILTNNPTYAGDGVSGIYIYSASVQIGTKRVVLPKGRNQLKYSEQFDNAYWSKVNSSVTPNTTLAPDKTISADTVTATGTSAYVNSSTVDGSVGTIHTYSVYSLKGKNISISGSDGVANGVVATFNGTTGAYVGSGITGAGWTVTSAYALDYGTFWRFVITITHPSAGSNFAVFINTALSTSWAAITGGGVCSIGDTMTIWGAQLTPTAWLEPYITTTNTIYDSGACRAIVPNNQNLIPNSQNMLIAGGSFTTSGGNCTEVAAGLTDPFGQPVFKYTPDTVNTYHRTFATAAVSTAVPASSLGYGVPKYISAVFKANGYNYAIIYISGGSIDSYTVDLINKVAKVNVGSYTTDATVRVVDLGNGYVYFEVMTRTVIVGSQPLQFLPFNAYTDVAIFTGDGTSGVYISSPCISQSPGNYAHFVGTTGTVVNAGVPRGVA